MDPELRRAWTEIVTADDYEEHMASIGQAQAAAELTRHLIQSAVLRPGSRITIAGAGTGQMFDFLDPAVFAGHRLTCSDLNPVFLARLRERLEKHGLIAELVKDDIEQSSLTPGPDLLLATLLLEHIDWLRGVATFARLRPRVCGIILQENPPSMSTAVTPGRRLPPSIAKAVETAHARPVPRDELIAAMTARGYVCRDADLREVADGKRLAGLLFGGT
ncbi:MAG TPA: class I SAM-dependent methyltransferase [Bryobacteraceae bacterium]|nr:class I SAM-dependent methyltransferase [Bryobacteraceae bacterium]